MKTIKLSYIILCSICLFLASCSSDEEITKGGASEELVKKAKDFLTGEIVLNTHATLNGVNKTLLEKDAPPNLSLTGVIQIQILSVCLFLISP